MAPREPASQAQMLGMKGKKKRKASRKIINCASLVK
jgi:hypothetical protein